MQRIEDHLKQYRSTYNKSIGVKEFFTLDNISDNSPWIEYKGFSVSDFIKNVFAPIRDYSKTFEQSILDLCKEIGLVKIYSETLQRDYWFVIYYFGEKQDEHLNRYHLEPNYMIGGEPEKSPLMIDEFKKLGWVDYPPELLLCWSIHGIWSLGSWSDFELIDFSKSFRSQEEITIPHYKALECSSINTLDKKCCSYSSIKKKNDAFIDKYILDGICLNFWSRPDSIHLIKPFDKEEFLEYFYSEYECFYDFNSLYEHLLELENEVSNNKFITQYFCYDHDGGFIGFCSFFEYVEESIEIFYGEF